MIAPKGLARRSPSPLATVPAPRFPQRALFAAEPGRRKVSVAIAVYLPARAPTVFATDIPAGRLIRAAGHASIRRLEDFGMRVEREAIGHAGYESRHYFVQFASRDRELFLG